MKETVNQNTAAVSTANEFNVEVLKKRLYDLSPEEIRDNFKKVKCVIRRQKYGKGDNVTNRFSAVLKFHDMFEVLFKLDQQEYLNICLGRNAGQNVIPDSLTINAYYVAVKAPRQDGTGSFHQLKVVISNNVRKKTFLSDLEVKNAELMKLFNFYDRPEFVEDDLDERKEELI